MKSPSLTSVRWLPLFLCAGIFASNISSLLAQSDTWDGGGSDNNWGTGLNWVDDTAPTPGSSSDLFFAGTTRLTSNNNYTAFDDFRNITFNSGAGAFTLTGSSIDLFGKIENLSSNTQTASFASIALNSASANEFNPVNGNLVINSNVINNGNLLNVYGNNGFSLTFGPSSVISGTGGVTIRQNSTVIYTGTNTYSGQTVLEAGKLQFGDGTSTGGSASSSAIFINNGATVNIFKANGGSVSNLIQINPTGGVVSGTNASGTTNTFSGTIFAANNGANGGNGTITSTNAGATLAFTGATAFDFKDSNFTFNGAGNTTVSGLIVDNSAGNLIKAGAGTLTLSNAANSYTGTTTINGGVLEATKLSAGGSNSSIGNSASAAANLVIDGGTLRYTGTGDSTSRNFSIGANGASLDSSGSGAVNFTSTTDQTSSGTGNRTFTLTGNNTGANILRGGIENPVTGSTSVVKDGVGSWTIGGGSDYTGITTVNNGTLTVDNTGAFTGTLGSTSSITVNSGGTLALGGNDGTDRLNNSASIILNGGTLNTLGNSERQGGATVTPGIGALTLQTSSIIDLSTGASILAFNNSNGQTWSGTLSIYNYSGTPFTGNGTDQLYFGTTTTGLTPAQLNQISFYSGPGTGFLGTGGFGTDADGEVVPVPEPRTWAAAALAAGLIGHQLFGRRKKQALLKAGTLRS